MADGPLTAPPGSVTHRRRRKIDVSAFRKWRRDRAGRWHLRDWLGRPIRAVGGARPGETYENERERHRAGSHAHRQRNLHLYERKFLHRRALMNRRARLRE